MVRHPHILNYELTASTEPTRNDDGDIIPGIPTTVSKSVKCRHQPNVRASYLISESDGSRLDFSAVIFLEKPESIPVGQNVTILNGANVIQTGSVKRFHQGQLQTRIWI